MPTIKSWGQAYNLVTGTLSMPLAAAADTFSTCADITVLTTFKDASKTTFNIAVAGVVNDGSESFTKTVHLLNDNGTLMVFDNLDKVVTLAKTVFQSANTLSIQVGGLAAVRGALRLTGDPAAAKARALAKVQGKLDKVTADEASQSASLATVSYYATGNAAEVAYFNAKTAQLANVTLFKNWATAEVARLSA